jgi:YVTN family beta-propeller protein
MGRKNIKTIATCLFVAFIFSACKKEESNDGPTPNTSEKRKVFVVCEGSFGNGNSYMTLYLPDKDSVYEDAFRTINAQELGDVFQSMTRIDNSYFLCLNNSDRVLSLNSNLTVNKYLSVPKPRYVLEINKSKAYVSSLYNNKVYIINPSTHSVTGSIQLPRLNTEGMALFNDRAFVCTWDTSINKIYSINTTTDQLQDSFIIAGYAPQEVLLDKEQKLWVLSGNVAKGKPAAWTRFDPNTGQILKSFAFPPNADPLHPVINNTKDTIYFIEVNYEGGTENNGIYRMSIHDASLPVKPFIGAAPFQYYWALGIEPVSGHIYVGDPKGFIQKGSVMVFTPDGTKMKEFAVGVGPGHFYFEQ